MKKILFIITQGEMGGAQRNVFDLAANLPRDLFKVVVGTGAEHTQLAEKCRNANTEVRIIKHLKRNISPLSDLAAISDIWRMCLDFRPDILHLHSSKAGIIGSIAGRLAGVGNIVFTAHGFHFLEPGNLFVRKISFILEKLACYFRKKIICVSEYDRSEAMRRGLCDEGKLVTIHNGIDRSRILHSNSEFARRGKQKSEIIIGTIAHDYATKDLKTMKEAFEMIKREFPSVKLKIIGRGSETGESSNAARLLPGFDIYVCSSIKEGFPYSILEAMATGLPIVSTDVGGIPEMIEHGKSGLLVPPKNPRALAEAIISLIKNPTSAASLATQAHERVKLFSLEQMLKKTEIVYQSLWSR